jgi:hypothetical protein
LSRACEDLAKDVADPDISLMTDPKVAWAEYVVGFEEAKGNLDATRECQRRQRERLAGGKK